MDASAVAVIEGMLKMGEVPTDKFAFTIPEAVKASGIGRSSLYLDIQAGRIRIKKRGSTTLILREELVRYLAALPDG